MVAPSPPGDILSVKLAAHGAFLGGLIAVPFLFLCKAPICSCFLIQGGVKYMILYGTVMVALTMTGNVMGTLC